MADWDIGELLQNMEEQNMRNRDIVLASWRAEYRGWLEHRLASLARYVEKHQRQRGSRVLCTLEPPLMTPGDGSCPTMATPCDTTHNSHIPFSMPPSQQQQDDTVALGQYKHVSDGRRASHGEDGRRPALCAEQSTSLLEFPIAWSPDVQWKREYSGASNQSPEFGGLKTTAAFSLSLGSGDVELWNTDALAVRVVSPPHRQRTLHCTNLSDLCDTPPQSLRKGVLVLDETSKESLAAAIGRLYDDTSSGPQGSWFPNLHCLKTRTWNQPVPRQGSTRVNQRVPSAKLAGEAERRAVRSGVLSGGKMMSKEQVAIELRRLYGLGGDNGT